MGVKGGPDIETDGLVFHLDAAATSIGKGYSTEGLRVEYLVVGGGGGGSGWGDGVGGGAGGFLSSVTRLTANTYSVIVGAGGNRGTNSSSSRGSNGGNSQIGDGIIAYGVCIRGIINGKFIRTKNNKKRGIILWELIMGSLLTLIILLQILIE